MDALWIVEQTANGKFPYRISIEQGGRLVFAVRAQNKWPGPGQQIFCLREWELDPDEALEPLERVKIVRIKRLGRKLAVVLDRGTRKRCEFLTIEKERKDGSGSYEQIFFRTEQGIRAHKSRSRLELRGTGKQLQIAIDSAERYPWRFADAAVVKRKLAVGDYALIERERTVAVVERKTFDNMLADVGAIQALHHQLADLSGYEHSAFVIEAQYADFLNDRKLEGRWPPSYLAPALAELTALHPRVPVVFAGNRKMANLWTLRFFEAVSKARESAPSEAAVEMADLFDPPAARPSIDEQIRLAVLDRLPATFTLAELAALFPTEKKTTVRRVLNQMRREGTLVMTGSRRGARWNKKIEE